MSKAGKSSSGMRLSAAMMLFYFLAFLLLALRGGTSLGYLLSLAVPGMIFLGTFFLPRVFPTDRLFLSLANFLSALGVLLLYASGSPLVLQQAVSYGIGLAAMIFCIYLVRCMRSSSGSVQVILFLSLMLLVLPVLSGKEINGALNWITIGSFSFQPSEIVKLSLVLILAGTLSRRQFLPALFFVLLCCLLLMLQRDLGALLLYFVTALVLFWAATGNFPLTLAGAAGGACIAWYGYHLFAHVRLRVSIWQNPWADAQGAGYQLVQGLAAISRGGLWGTGLGLGNPAAVPVYESDFIFPVLCEQFGLVFAGCILILYVMLIFRGTEIASNSADSFHSLLAMGASFLLGLQTFVNIGGVLKLIPLTGVTLPFISYGGTSLISSLCLAGFIQGVESLNKDQMEEDRSLAMLERG